jgi:hypothetical protein
MTIYFLLTEPTSPRYIHINPANNKVHLMVPVVGGQEISTDNTCQARVALRDFFEGQALKTLNAYKKALALDIGLLNVLAKDNPQRAEKEARFVQIDAYIEAVSAMRMSYGFAMTAVLQRPSNLYSIQLRPRAQDNLSRVVNPTFTVNRTNDATGTPASLLYHAMHSTFPRTVVAVIDPRTRLKAAVFRVLPAKPDFEDIQQTLSEQSLALFGLDIDFTKRTDGTPATKEAIGEIMEWDEDVSPEEYIDGLLGACALDVWVTLPTPPFYSIPDTTVEAIRTERLSILTQFFLSIVNIYCKARGISTQNFGTILDVSEPLSNDLVSVIATALSANDDVERQVCNFCNEHATKFGLSRPLSAEDVTIIRQKFERTYRAVTATNENPHMDDFMILDNGATGETAKFVTHQGSICVNFAEFIDPTTASRHPDYFASIRDDFTNHPVEVPHQNKFVESEIIVSVDIIYDKQFRSLFKATTQAVRDHITEVLGENDVDFYKIIKNEQKEVPSDEEPKQKKMRTP